MPNTSSVELVLANDTTSARTARHAVQTLLGEATTIEFVRNAILLTSELVTNSIVHATGACALLARFDPRSGTLRVEVADTSAAEPMLISGSTRDRFGGEGGLGLQLVDTVATAWGVSPSETGKTTWFELDPG